MTDTAHQDLRGRLRQAFAPYIDPDDGTVPTWPHGGSTPVWVPADGLIDSALTAFEDTAPALTGELRAEVFKLIRFAIADPAAFVPRDKAGDGETVPNWGARAVVAALENHPVVAIRPDRPTQWAYDQACKALEKHRDRADKAEARLAELGEPPSVELPNDRDGVVKVWFRTYLQWRYQAGRADEARAERDAALTQCTEAERLIRALTDQRDQAMATRDGARAALDRARALANKLASLAPEDDWGDDMPSTVGADVGRQFLAALDGSGT